MAQACLAFPIVTISSWCGRDAPARRCFSDFVAHVDGKRLRGELLGACSANASGGARYDSENAAHCRIIPPSIIRT